MKIQLQAVTPLTFGGKRLAKGDTFEASTGNARILKAIGKARDYTPEEAATPAPVEAKAETGHIVETGEAVKATAKAPAKTTSKAKAGSVKTKSGTYKTKDMKAQQ